MNIYAFFSFLGAIISFAIAIFSYSKNPKGSLNRIFAILCLSVSFYGFIEFGLRQADNLEEALFWFFFTPIYVLIATLWIHFMLLFSEKYNIRDKKWIIFSIYLFTMGLVFINFYLYVYRMEIELDYWGWDYGDLTNPLLSFFLYLSFTYILFCFVFGLYLSIWVYFNSSSSNKKQQAKFISIGCIIPVLLFLLTDFFISTILQLKFPSFSVFGYSFSCLFIFYAIWKYELFSLDLTIASDKIFSTISDYLILTNLEGKILSSNQGLWDLLQYQEKELKGKLFVFLLATEQDRKLYQYQFQLLIGDQNGEFLKDIEVDFKTKANEKIKISLTASKISDKIGNLRGIIYIGRNITNTRKIEQQLKEAVQKSQFKSKFMMSMSHELRTPLNAIMGFVDLLLEDHCGPLNKCQNDFLSDVKLSSNDLLELINHLLSLSKIEAGELALEIKGINIDTLLKHIQTILKPLCRKKNLEFHIEKYTTSEFISADFIRLKEILFNLLHNAVKFTQKGRVTLRVKELNDCFEFNIIDTGIGIAEEEFINIFEEFKKIKNPEIQDSQGVGLGLAITHHLVNLHGGQISFSSELGKGSTFTCTIPK